MMPTVFMSPEAAKTARIWRGHASPRNQTPPLRRDWITSSIESPRGKGRMAAHMRAISRAFVRISATAVAFDDERCRDGSAIRIALTLIHSLGAHLVGCSSLHADDRRA